MESKSNGTASDERRVVTASDIGEIVGELDPAAVASIIATGATRDELLEAFSWLSSDDSLHRALHHGPRGRVAQVYDILDAEIALPDDR